MSVFGKTLRIGPAGWSYEDWKGVVYPSPRPRGFHEAAYLAHYFPVIEINTSFYRPLRPELAQLWVKKIESFPRFQFTAKLYRAFTHQRILNKDDVRNFKAGLDPLFDAGRLGCVLMQFPWSFRHTPENAEHLKRLQSAFRQFPLVAEFRHVSWNDEGALKTLAENGIGFANIDQPQMHHCLPPTSHVTSPIGYVRLHGRNYEEWFNFDEDKARRDGITSVQARYNYLYSAPQLEKWTDRIRQVVDSTKAAYVITNNHFRGQAVVNALQLLAMTSDERSVDVPPVLLDYYPELQAITRKPPEQRSLFLVPPAHKEEKLAS